ncbi:MAG: F0F1 ATP synthase subunit A [Lactobacillaceae bacterium]|jgi:F-type H+-transporting ATPase subunit a|nr:F0F1 ATP synthase subunit A [Lactobacillaceae bacterium]
MFSLFGLWFDWTTIISTTVTFVIVLALGIFLSRNLKVRPTKKQNFLEWIIDFTNGVVKDQIAQGGQNFRFYVFVLFLFVFVSNQIGLAFQFSNSAGTIQIKSITAEPLVTLTLALISLMIAHFAGVEKFGLKGYIKNTYLSPFPGMLPLNLLEQITSFLTLGLRLYGNIFAGEILLNLIANMVMPNNLPGTPLGIIAGIFLELVWQAFSIFIGSIQAYIFATMTSVYINEKINVD